MNTQLWLWFDLVLTVLLIGTAWTAVMTRDLKRGMALFIAFGLLLAIAWSRLRAPDLALAEAVIGAGIAGALLLAALQDAPSEGRVISSSSPTTRWLLDIGVVSVAVMLGWALLDAMATGDRTGLSAAVEQNLSASGVLHPVTAVLLNFRSYDTLLELVVILAAAAGVLTLGTARRPFRSAGPVLSTLIRWLVPMLVVMAGYLLWVGAHAPGGAFQAGATLAAAAILTRIGGHARFPPPKLLRWMLVVGVVVFLSVGLLTTLAELAVLQYPETWAGVLILVIESAAMLSIATALAIAYLGGRPDGWK